MSMQEQQQQGVITMGRIDRDKERLSTPFFLLLEQCRVMAVQITHDGSWQIQ